MEKNSGCGSWVMLVVGGIIILVSLSASGGHIYTSMDDKWWGAPLSIVGGFIALMGWLSLKDKGRE